MLFGGGGRGDYEKERREKLEKKEKRRKERGKLKL
jgi:hypothetical protein